MQWAASSPHPLPQPHGGEADAGTVGLQRLGPQGVVRPQAEPQGLAGGGGGPQQGLVAVENGGPAGRQTLQDLQLGLADALPGAQVFDVHGADVGDDGHLGPGDPGEPGELSGVVHAHLHHGGLRPPGDAQHRQGDADVVVVVALGLDGVIDAAAGGGGHLLCGGLAHTAGQADEAGALQAAPPAGGQVHQAPETVRHHNHRHAGKLPLPQHRRGALFQGRGDEVVTVPLRPQGDEELPRRQPPGVVAGALEGDVLVFG